MTRTVVIGASRAEKLPAKVCEHTVLKHAANPPKIIHTWDKVFGDTPVLRGMNKSGFSYVRFAVPALTNYEGAAVYLDSDMIIFRDIEGLFGLPFDGAVVLRPKNQTAVLVYDCAKLKHWNLASILSLLETGEIAYKDLMDNLFEKNVRVAIPPSWNQMDIHHKDLTALLHYTDRPRQPWLTRGHPYQKLWYVALREAIAVGRITMDEVQREVDLGHVGQWVLEEARRPVHA